MHEKYFLWRIARIHYFMTFLERFMVFLDWSSAYSWWILIHFNNAFVHFNWHMKQKYILLKICLLKKQKCLIKNSWIIWWNEMLPVQKRFNAAIMNCIWYRVTSDRPFIDMFSDFATLFCFNLFTKVLRTEWLVIYFDDSNGDFDMTLSCFLGYGYPLEIF